MLCVFYFFFHEREHIWRFIIENTYATERALCIRYLLWSVITHHIQLWWKWTDMISYAVGELHFINYKLLCFSCAHTQSHPPFLFCFIWIEAFVPYTHERFFLHRRDLISCYEITLLDMVFCWCQNHIIAIVLQNTKHLHREREKKREKHQMKIKLCLAVKWTWAWIYSSTLFSS